MSDASRSGRAPLIIIAVVVGVLIGAALGLYAAYAILPPELVLRDGSPRFLRYDPTGGTVQYRDYYIARVAQRFAQGTQGGTGDAAWQEAQAALGLSTGDASPLAALKMVRDAELAASTENKADGPTPDAGRFTLADENYMKSLGDQLETVRDQAPVVAQSVIDARRNTQIFGLLAVALLAIFLLGLLFLLSNLLARPATVATTTATRSTERVTERSTGGVSATYVPPARAEELRDVIDPDPIVIDPVSTEPGTTYAPVRAASPVAGETLIKEFHATYRHGMERYDESFEISSPTGDLVGECGSTIEHRYGLDVPARVVALTVWVFDKPDFQSTTSVFATPFALSSEGIRRELQARGQLVEAKPGAFEVTTGSLRVEVDVRNLVLQPIEGMPEGYIDSVDFDFRVYKRV